MLQERIQQAITNIQPNGDPDVQLIVTAADVMVNEVLPDINLLIEISPYRFNRTGNSTCVFCKNSEEESHSEACSFDRLLQKATFFNQHLLSKEEENDS